MIRRYPENSKVLDAVSASTGLPQVQVHHVVTALRDCIDRLVLDGCSIVAPPFTLTYETDDVVDPFVAWQKSATDEQIAAWQEGDERIAGWLGLSQDQYLEREVVSSVTLAAEVLEWLSIPAGTIAEDETLAIVDGWLDTFEEPRRYVFSDVGLERDLEQWLVDHPEKLSDHGYDVLLRDRQLVLPDRRRPDLVFDLLLADHSTGSLIVELKAVPGSRGAVDQLCGYVAAMQRHALGPTTVRGLLIADGFSPGSERYAHERGVGVLTLSRLGYRSIETVDGLVAGATRLSRTLRG